MVWSVFVRMAALLAVSVGPVYAWTTPTYVSNIGTNFGLSPRVAPGFGGKLYMAWHEQVTEEWMTTADHVTTDPTCAPLLTT